MKPTLAASLLLAAATFIYHAQAIGNGPCCIGHTLKPLPLKLLDSYMFTNSKCALPAVIFVTKGNRRFCADPKAEWTKDGIRRLTLSGRSPPPPAAAL
ncbi:hypothetical protein lerEdw1_004726 [Lerista edwardsae]|nr:hypothetical protein lerEdw1_004726 [Lerista edwardsae]